MWGGLLGVPYMIVASLVGLPLWIVALGFVPGLIVLGWVVLVLVALPEPHEFAIGVVLLALLGLSGGWLASLTMAGGLIALRLLVRVVDAAAERAGFQRLFDRS